MASKKSNDNGGKTIRGRFVHGNKAASGRPPGARNKTTLVVERLLDGQADAIGQKCIEMALEGDTTAMRLVMERVAPVRKGRPVIMTLPAIKTADDLVGAMSSVVKAMAAGDVTPEEALVVAGVLEVKRKAIETVEHEQRLIALESRK